MNYQEVLEYLNSTYKADVLNISPHKEISTYQDSLNTMAIITHGHNRGKVVPKNDCIIIALNGYSSIHQVKYFAIHNSEIKKVGYGNLHQNPMLVKFDTNFVLMEVRNRYYKPSDFKQIKDVESVYWFPVQLTVTLDDYWYDDNIQTDVEQTVITADGERILCRHAVSCEVSDYYFHEDDERLVRYSHGGMCNRESDCVGYAEDTNEYHHVDDLIYDDEDDCYYTREYYENSNQVIRDYHCGVEPTFYNSPKPEIRLSQYSIGFEVEKNYLNGKSSGKVQQEALFSHWERDSSCGVEGITNVYGLDQFDKFSSHVDDSVYVNEPVDSTCGGHINISHHDNKLEMWHLKPWMGLNWALWRKRLNNDYSSRNKKCNPYEGRSHHYGCLVEKGRPDNKRFELRLPPRVSNGNILLNRFKIIQAFISCVDMYMNEQYKDYNSTDWQDKYFGLPNWVSSELDRSKCLYVEQVAAATPLATYKRIRYLIEASKDVLTSIYTPETTAKIVAYAYGMQHYIDIPFGKNVPETTNKLINNYISTY